MQTAQTILALARSPARTDRERLLLSIADLCDAGLPPGATLEPQVLGMVDAIFRDLVARAERDIRRSLTERLAGAAWPPHGLVALLACDEIEVARPLIAASPVLTDEDLIEVLRQTVEHQIEVARRPGIGPTVVERILDQGAPEVLIALADNDRAELSEQVMERLVESSREVAGLRTALARHQRLTQALAERLYLWVGDSLRQTLAARFNVDTVRLGEAIDQAVNASLRTVAYRSGIMLAQAEERRHMERQLVTKLHEAGQLKPGYLVRALHEQRLSLFTVALAELAGVEPSAIDAAIESDKPELLALACTAAGVDRSAFSTILSLVRQLTAGRPAGGAGSGRRAQQAFAIHDPQMAGQAFREAIAPGI